MKLPELKIGNLIAKLPIIQGGMGVGISMAGLASAVANEGGIGVISSVGLGSANDTKAKNHWESNKIALREEIRKAKKLTKGIIGVNIMMALTDYAELVKISLEEADIVFIGAGLPLRLPKNISFDFVKSVKAKIVPIVSSARAAKIIFKSWEKNYSHIPDAVVVEGPLAGGHLGFKQSQIDDPAYKLENLIPEVVSAIKPFIQKFAKKIPVIAAGGIFNGVDIHKFLNLGADGVQLGTRFVATHECDADIKFKNEYIRAKKEDIVIIKSPVGLPGRAVFNKFLSDVEQGIKKPFKCDWQCLKTCNFRTTLYCIAQALLNSKIGKLSDGFSFAGANAYRIDKIISVKELMDTLVAEYEKVAFLVNQNPALATNNL
ncbi:MAG: nitronate monooxygenase [Candidatus Cloacimonetes bacterium]|nr:nitronate monooxygenase [Candidatus Cloacimonadota bacterium]